MDDKTGLLSEADKETIRGWLVKNGAVLPCASCGHQAFGVGPLVVLAPTYVPGSLVGAGYPLIALVCGKCSYVKFYSAILAGIVAPDKPGGKDGK